ncbi:MAG: heme-dependent oxidative N-demethylase subunit alpha family protein [Caldimonas sp.]
MAFDFSHVVAPFRMQPGLRRLAPGAQHLTPNRLDSPALHEKLAVLASHPAQALVAMPGFDAAPALHALAAQAGLEHPDAFASESTDACTAIRLGWTLRRRRMHGSGPAEIGACIEALPPEWRLAGLLSLAFAEDFAVLDAATHRIPWLAVCLPSRWAPEDKVGGTFAEVHAPVADSAVLVAAADPLLRLVTGAQRWERFVWTLADGPQLQRHPHHCAPTRWNPLLDPNALAATAYFRTERQTFIPLTGRRQALFTIHVEVRPLIAALESNDDAVRLHAALASMSPAVLDYRGLAPARARLLAWLEMRASGRG